MVVFLGGLCDSGVYRISDDLSVQKAIPKIATKEFCDRFMFRRIICLALIGSLIASQLAAVPHAHCNLTTAESLAHAHTPHFHIHGGHSHGGNQAHSHQHVDRNNLRLSEPHASSKVVAIGQSGHDCDAIFYSAHVMNSSHVKDKNASDRCLLVGEWYYCDSFSMESHAIDLTVLPPPDILPDSSEIYLVLQNLRI